MSHQRIQVENIKSTTEFQLVKALVKSFKTKNVIRYKNDPKPNAYDKNADDLQQILIDSFGKIVSNRYFVTVSRGNNYFWNCRF